MGLGALLVGNMVSGGATGGFIGHACESMSEFPVSESISTALMEAQLQVAGTVLTQLSSGKNGFEICAGVLCCVTIIFVSGQRPATSSTAGERQRRRQND